MDTIIYFSWLIMKIYHLLQRLLSHRTAPIGSWCDSFLVWDVKLFNEYYVLTRSRTYATTTTTTIRQRSFSIYRRYPMGKRINREWEIYIHIYIHNRENCKYTRYLFDRSLRGTPSSSTAGWIRYRCFFFFYVFHTSLFSSISFPSCNIFFCIYIPYLDICI